MVTLFRTDAPYVSLRVAWPEVIKGEFKNMRPKMSLNLRPKIVTALRYKNFSFLRVNKGNKAKNLFWVAYLKSLKVAYLNSGRKKSIEF